jgi:hypothetical protein
VKYVSVQYLLDLIMMHHYARLATKGKYPEGNRPRTAPRIFPRRGGSVKPDSIPFDTRVQRKINCDEMTIVWILRGNLGNY